MSILLLAGCSDINDIMTESGDISTDEVKRTLKANPARFEAELKGLFTMGFIPGQTEPSDDDCGIFTIFITDDCAGPDMVTNFDGSNWFNYSARFDDRIRDSRTNAIIFFTGYKVIGAANSLIKKFDVNDNTEQAKTFVGNAKAMRAYMYLLLAPHYQRSYIVDKTAPCLPLVTDQTPEDKAPALSSVETIYNQIISDLTEAKELLANYKRPDKRYFNNAVICGLLARTYLAMGDYSKALQFSQEAIETTDAKPASIADVSKPTFCNASEQNWMWGAILTNEDVAPRGLATSTSQLCSFLKYGYTTVTQNYRDINVLLYKKISDTDVRKEWWIAPIKPNSLTPAQSNSHLKGLEWTEDNQTLKENEIILGRLPSKLPFRAFTNIKFGMKEGVGADRFNNDIPLMRIEEMHLIKAEALAMTDKTSEAKQELESLIKTYRDPQYAVSATTKEQLQNEVWLQRRIELWGEGFSLYDVMRLQKPIIKIQGGVWTNMPSAYWFNIKANEHIMHYPIVLKEMNNNANIINNYSIVMPQRGENKTLRDGVTD